MAAHVWTSGEAITASKLNAIERKRAWVNGELPLETLTWNEAIALFEEVGECRYSINYSEYTMSPLFNMLIEYYADSATSLLQKNTVIEK